MEPDRVAQMRDSVKLLYALVVDLSAQIESLHAGDKEKSGTEAPPTAGQPKPNGHPRPAPVF